MSRYIDADTLKQNLKENYTFYGFVDLLKDFYVAIDEAPSIDIVRCKECKHNPWNTDADYTCIWDDDFADREQTLNDFCSYGEREGE